MKLSLPTDSEVRKTYPLFNALFGYFAAALAGVAHHSWKNNEKHNPGESMHWSFDKSNDHADCCMRHLMDVGDMLAYYERQLLEGQPREDLESAILAEANANAWRALALSQSLHMRFANAPLPFNATRDEGPMFKVPDDFYAPPAPPRGLRGIFNRGCDTVIGPCACGATH